MNRRTFTISALLSLLFPSACKSQPSKPSEFPYFTGREVSLSKGEIEVLRARARNLPVYWDVAEVVVRYEGKERRMTYEEFLVRTGMV